jgi:hypothetical protein
MNDQLQQAIADLLNKFGIVIDKGVDWTSDMFFPYIQELIHRMQIYKIVTSSLLLAFIVLIFILCGIFFKKAYSANKLVEKTGEENWCFHEFGDWKDSTAVACIVSGVAILGGLFISVMCIDSIISWAIMPDVNFIKYLGNMLSA